ncbi:PilN domain-containing protein [Acidisoma cellulosilytica]|uniref:PilN domain-containing protein n=1 Tax=Acidisoma cellulosilyticum TaxID=2802395 RepID=A0A963Z5Y6_9PROT|nr:PilN domain-containing protein [Acidisoma cellulosilyticum]MCB8883213.1 PilN domain-containing protein [Acidisoma cellulosilyticum]
MLAEFLTWWTRQWQTLVPISSKLLPDGKTPGVTVRVQSTGDDLNISLEIGGDGQQTVVLPLNDEGLALLRAMPGAKHAPLRLLLPPGTILERAVSLPSAVERDLGQVLQYDMNRLTPFTVADVFWDWVVAGQDKRLGKLDVRLRLAKRDKLAPILGALQTYGLHPDCMESRGAQAGSPFRVIRLKQEKTTRSARTPIRIAALAVCCLLFVTLCATPFLRQQIEIATIGRQIAALQPSVAAAASLRRSITADAESNSVLSVERSLSGAPLQVLASVTDALPDGTWLTDLTLQQRVLRLDGESHAAAQLIGKLAGVDLIGNPAFIAPVTSDTDRHTDVFSISAEIRP